MPRAAASVAGLQLQLQLGGEPRGAQQAQRVVGEGALADHPQQAAIEVGKTAVGVERAAALQRHRDRADREVAGGEVGLDAPPSQDREIDLPAAVAGRRPPGGELAGELERVPAGGAGDCHRALARIVGDRQVEVGDRPAQRRVPHRSADDPVAAALAQGVRTRCRRGRLAQPLRDLGGAHEKTRGTRAEIPQVTS